VSRRVGGDHDAGEVQAVQQRLGQRGLVGGGVGLALGHGRAVGVVHGCQQLDRVAVMAGRAAEGLAAGRDRPPAVPAGWAQPAGQPCAQGVVEQAGVDAGGHAADRRGAGSLPRPRQRVTAGAERGQDVGWRVSGPLGGRGDRPGTGQHRRGGNRQHPGQGVSSPSPVAWVGDCGQTRKQPGACTQAERAAVAAVGGCGRDGG